MSEGNVEGVPDGENLEELVLADLAAIVDQEHLRLRRERQLRRLGRALQRLGITALTAFSRDRPNPTGEAFGFDGRLIFFGSGAQGGLARAAGRGFSKFTHQTDADQHRRAVFAAKCRPAQLLQIGHVFVDIFRHRRIYYPLGDPLEANSKSSFIPGG